MADGGTSEGDKISVILRAGASIVGSKPTFSPDTKYLLCTSGNAVKVLSTVSGECVHELRRHTAHVTSIKINPANQYQLFSCSLDKTLIKWDFTDGVVLKVYQLYRPLLAIYVTPASDTTLLVKRKIAAKECELVKVDLSRYDPDVPPRSVLRQCGHRENQVSVGCKGSYVATVGKKGLTVHSFKKNVTTTHLMEKDKFKLTCIACHPVEYCLATGCETGEIILWWNVLAEKAAVRKNIRHWHALSVLDLTFSPGGSFMLSGGHECVLVKWQHNSHTYETLPRLGAPIIAVSCSPDGTAYSTCHTDNSIRIISNSFNVQQIFQGLVRAFATRKQLHVTMMPLVFDPRTRALVCNGQPGHIQFYAVVTDKQLFSLDIVQQNYISSATLNRPLVFTEIEQVAFSEDGDWLATVERRDDHMTAAEMRLKFWIFDKQTQGYELNTCVELPHDQGIHTLCFRAHGVTESSPMVVTTSSDGKFKLWVVADDTNIYRKNTCWRCESVGFYRDLEAGSADFSVDGSLLAVAFKTTITLWDPDTNHLRMTLPSVATGNVDVKARDVQVLFGTNNCCHLLAVHTGHRLSIWNLLTCTVQWSMTANIQRMTRNPFSDDIAVFTVERGLKVFNMNCAQPIYEHDRLSETPITNAIFIPYSQESADDSSGALSWQQRAQLYFINHKQELLTLEKTDEESTAASTATVSTVRNLPQTPFSILLSWKREKDTSRSISHETHNQFASQFLKQMLDTPAHVLPPVSSLCNSFLETLLIRKHDGAREGEDSDDEDKEMDMSASSESDSEEEVNKSGKNSESMEIDTTRKPRLVESKLHKFSEIGKNEKMFAWMDGS